MGAVAAKKRDEALQRALAVEKLLSESKKVLAASKRLVETRLGKTEYQKSFGSSTTQITGRDALMDAEEDEASSIHFPRSSCSARRSDLLDTVSDLCELVYTRGTPSKEGNSFCMSFGEVFACYAARTSLEVESLSGVLQRAKRANLLEYEGDSLFSGVHDDVLIWTV